MQNALLWLVPRHSWWIWFIFFLMCTTVSVITVLVVIIFEFTEIPTEPEILPSCHLLLPSLGCFGNYLLSPGLQQSTFSESPFFCTHFGRGRSNYRELFGWWSVKGIAPIISVLQTDRYLWNLCLEVRAAGSIINMHKKQVADKAFHWSNWKRRLCTFIFLCILVLNREPNR